jgi:hypothetical protein
MDLFIPLTEEIELALSFPRVIGWPFLVLIASSYAESVNP